MLLADAQARLSELMTMTILYWDEIGPDWAATNEALLSEALAGIAAASDVDAFMAEIESAVTHYDPSTDDDFDFDNSGAIVILDDGTEMSYDAYAEAGLEGSGEPDLFADMAPVFEFIGPLDLLDPLEARKPFVGIDEMCHMEA